MIVNTPIKNNKTENKDIINSFFNFPIAFQLINKHIGINIILSPMKNMLIPSTTKFVEPQRENMPTVWNHCNRNINWKL